MVHYYATLLQLVVVVIFRCISRLGRAHFIYFGVGRFVVANSATAKPARTKGAADQVFFNTAQAMLARRTIIASLLWLNLCGQFVVGDLSWRNRIFALSVQ